MLTLGVVILSLGAVAGAAVADDITFTTDITGANVTIDLGNTQTYDFVVNPGHVVNNIIGDFTIKSGTSASQDILFSVYDGFNGTGHVNGTFTANGTEVGAAALTAADVPQSYTTEVFAIHSLNLLPGNYSVALHSSAGGIGADQYFFKNQGFSSTSDGSAISIGTSSSTATPEPSGMLAGLGFLGTLGGGFLHARRRRRNR